MQDKISQVLRAWLVNLRISLFVIVLVSVGSAIHSFVTRGYLYFGQMIFANIAIGTALAAGGVFLLFFPAMIKRDKLLDHSTYLERMYEAREKKRTIAYQALFVGLVVIMIAALVEFALWGVL